MILGTFILGRNVLLVYPSSKVGDETGVKERDVGLKTFLPKVV